MIYTPFEQAIRALGETVESVSLKLTEMGVKGYRCRAGCCPIANYLKACGFPQVSVATHANRYRSPEQGDSEESVILPKHVRDWIIEFDDGKYPAFYQE